MVVKIDQSYMYQDISLVPRHLSEVRSRMDIDLSTGFSINDQTFNLRMPILPAPMDTIGSEAMCEAFYENGMLGTIHRFNSGEKRLDQYLQLVKKDMDAFVSVGLEEKELIEKFYSLGARLYTLDVANGFNSSIESTIRLIKGFDDTFVVTGNVASGEGFQYLSDLGVDAIRVGIGNGSMCTTSIMTGVGQGIVSAIMECVSARKRIKSDALIISDGGITNVGDICKALALGADLVMMGRMFAGTKESEGNILKYQGKLYKIYRGSASYAVQQMRRKNPYYIEGDETIVEYKGRVQNVFDQIEAGLRSAFSYLASRNIGEFRENASFVFYRYQRSAEVQSGS